MNIGDRIYGEGKQAWRDGKPVTANPYWDSIFAITWAQGWHAAREKAEAEQPTYWSMHDSTNETQETR